MQKIDIQKFTCPPFKEALDEMRGMSKAGKKPVTATRGGVWVIREGLTPVDLYCYLNARFGRPNGFQMALRKDDSDNLIHWHYTLKYGEDRLDIMCMTFRVDIMHSFEFSDSLNAKKEFLKDIKNDFSNYGNNISEFRKTLEKWSLFVNPFFRIKSVIEQQLTKLEQLNVGELEPLSYPSSSEDLDRLKDKIGIAGKIYTEATALGLNIRMLAPVYAESFINLLIFLLADADIKNDKRMYDSVVRQQIDIRIKGLHRHCRGFFQPVDYNNVEACKEFHTLMNNRNDLLHGNIDPKKLVFETVYFDGRIPLFNDYRNFSFYSYEASIRNVTPDLATGDYQIVQDLIAYILVCLEDKIREEVMRFMETKDPGWNEADKRPGVLFPDHMVDMFPKFEDEEFNKRVN